ncbi:MAG: N-acetyltransferase [Mesorhizobium sp.]|nr:MAG: N-acetyltransferase [Mesorhizobium sp.]
MREALGTGGYGFASGILLPFQKLMLPVSASRESRRMPVIMSTRCSFGHENVPTGRMLMITYQTERLILTPIQRGDEAELLKLNNDPLVRKANFNNVPQTIESVHEWLNRYSAQWRKNRFGVWLVYEKCNAGQMFIGRCGLQDHDDNPNPEFAYAFFEHATGRGLGPEAARFTITHAFRNSTKKKVIGFIAPGNERAERAANKLGLRYIDDRLYEGNISKYYEMTREEYFSKHH